jgi:hypothetical protein
LAGPEGDPPDIEGRIRLAPVAFDPDVAFAVVVPVAVDPVSVGVGWFDVSSGDPDVGAAVPAVVAGVPGPVGMLVWGRRNGFIRTRRGTDANDDLGLCNSCGEQKAAGGSEKEFLHRILLVVLVMPFV